MALLVGDGGFSMLMAEFGNCVQYQLPIKIVIVKNNSLGMIKWEQMVFLGNPEYGCELHPIDFAAFARACGGTGFTVDDPKRCGDVLDEALATAGPVIVEAVVDPFTPPMPPKVTASRAGVIVRRLMTALLLSTGPTPFRRDLGPFLPRLAQPYRDRLLAAFHAPA